VTGDVTNSELAEVCQRSHVSVTGRNSIPPQGSRPEILRNGGLWRADRVLCAAAGFETKAETPRVVMVNGEVRNKDPEVRHWRI